MGKTLSNSKWYKFYYLLAVFDILVVLLGVYFNHLIVSAFNESVAVNQRWERRLDRYLELGELAGAVNAPGNDVFASQKPAEEAARQRDAVNAFSSHMRRLREDLRLNIKVEEAGPLLEDMARADAVMNEMVSEAGQVFALFAQGNGREAGPRMARMNEKYSALNMSLANLRKTVSGIQNKLFEQQRQAAANLQRYEQLMGLAVFLMIVGAFFYVHKVRQRMAEADEAQARHIRELSAAEMALREARNHLEQKVEERTGELRVEVVERLRAQQYLQNYAAKLESSNRELQDFAHVASHDLQEPLRKVQAFGDRLVTKYRDDLPAEGRDYVDRMQNATRRMQTLIEDLLTFSRVATKAEPFRLVSLREVAQGVVGDLEIRIEKSQAQVEIGDLPEVEADALQMRQLMQNLIGNALKFRRPGAAPFVKVYSQPIATGLFGGGMLAESSDTCRIYVEDNGIGFDEKYLDKIFTVFQRLHGRQEYEGSGIGLAVCRKIVERHNGSITARSAPGQGATFVITLPLKQLGEPSHG
jgi:signal transduction histidine kinase